ENSGFGSVRSFYRQFKEKYNMSPAEYRKLVK
ncbi:MAG: helix-turn-helix domain-containing protein, partial [Bacteroidales bacterium]|nr:helix-turn-helix domain-containing protein [Bacteroidales bacterium]